MFNEVNLSKLVPELEAKGVTFGPGLTDNEIESIEHTCAFAFPPDLRAFLQYALPIEHQRGTSTGRFPDWRGDLGEILSYVEMMTLGIADYLRGSYDLRGEIIWCDLWGERPSDIDQAVKRLRELIEQAPKLIPVYGHRFMPALPETGNPVYSVMDLDTIYLGFDLARYFANEFRVTRPSWTVSRPRVVQFWHDLVVCNAGYVEGKPEF
jgi:hypothetical protein